ncbi:uncharacterized protein DNG_08016 [Cephalotrichum gorgonifer]|uniref:Peptidase S8/S53 domain-containing protein n=1 Tax=Cephalotrichum gorgonifer TaxID=2041049 RepID=A0AAE8N4D1_9PEZI|nr:uncharacterized protein DNG_08016 [Cephalotrichum gorgonifer]
MLSWFNTLLSGDSTSGENGDPAYGDLVLSALPVLYQVCEDLSPTFELRDKRSDYLKNIQSSALVLKGQFDNIKSADDFERFEGQINRLASCLEKIFDALQVPDIPNKENDSVVPRLEALYRVSKKADCKLDLSRLVNLDGLKSLQNQLARLTDELKPFYSGNNPVDMEDSKLPKAWQPPDEGGCNFFDRALGAMLCKCGAHSMRTLRLGIGTHRKDLKKPNPKSLRVLFPWEAKAGEWLELFVHDGTSTNIEVVGNGELSNRTVCDYLATHHVLTYRLDLVLRQNNLSRSARDPYDRDSQCLQKQIDLKSLLSHRERSWNVQTSRALAVVLSYTLLYMYGGSHFRGLWRRENILFFHDGRHIPLQPFLGTIASPATWYNDDSAPSDQHHRHPDIVMLGVMLLEIQLGQRLETFLGLEKDIMNDNEFYLYAWRAFLHPEASIIPERYRGVIRACISAKTFNKLNSDDQKIRLEFFERIIKPLDEDIYVLFGRLDFMNLDKTIAKKCDLACGLRLPLPALLPTEISSQDESTPDNQEAVHAEQMEAHGHQYIGEMDAESNGAVFFDAKTVVDGINEISRWQDWLGKFTKFRRQILPQPINPENEERVRVTIIDTGIDGLHPFIQSAGWSKDDPNAREPLFRNFADGEEGSDRHNPIDEDGHGTFIAGLLLQAAPDIELSVARIGSTREEIRRDLKVDTKISKAIEHAIEKWDAEIISISFGKRNPSDELRAAVANALTKKKILLAAVGNGGETEPMAFPARRKGVFKILATEMNGALPPFTSVPENKDDTYCFAIPGHRVVSTWPSGLVSRAEESELDIFCWDSETAQPRSGCQHTGLTPCDWRTVMSGTSFATPIAAALVALIYQFYNVNKESEATAKYLQNRTKDILKTPDGIQAILREMSRSNQTRSYNILVPLWGREKRMEFKAVQGASTGCTILNEQGQTAVQFFADRLSQILRGADI